MSKISLENITSGYNLNKVNTNFDSVEAALNDRVLWRNNVTGEPNTMEQALDMNGKAILNLPAPATDSSPVRVADLYSVIEANSDTDLALNLADTTDALKGDALIGVKQTSGTGRNLHTRIADVKYITDYNSIVADGTDQTSAITTWLQSLASDKSELYVIPWNCKFSYTSVIPEIPVGVVFWNFSALNGYANPGDTAKRFGLLSGDDAGNDTGLEIVSGHHPLLQFNNYGLSGTTSATNRNQTILYSSGEYQIGPKGYREMGAYIFKKSNGNNWWEWNWNKLAPMAAVTSEFERWYASTAYTLNKYIMAAPNIYKCTVAGTTGLVAPSHTSGTATDGGCTWEWICTNEENILALDEYGRLRSNGGVASTDLISFKQRADDPATTAIASIQAGGATKNVFLYLTPTNGSGVAVTQPVLKASVAGGLEVVKSTGASLLSFTDADGPKLHKLCENETIATNNDTSPSVANAMVLYLDNSSATPITTLDDGRGGQVVELHAITGNTTFVNSATFILQGGVNISSFPVHSILRMRKVPSSIVGASPWVEVYRNIK